jgi:hypothetical protein
LTYGHFSAFRGKMVSPSAGTKLRNTKGVKSSKEVREAKQKEESGSEKDAEEKKAK